ncbi:heavy metal sensor histidine kinase, partial [Stenotrophomonas maltophilia]
RQTLADGSPLVTLLAIDDDRHADFLQRFRHLLAIAIIGAAVASSLLGGYVVRRTLRPLRTLADEARQITAGRLQRRLSARSAPAELEQLAQTLNGMLARLQQDFARLTEFSGDLAHELRTPITNMLTQVQVVLAHPRSNEAYRETLASCAEELQQLAQTVGDLLYLAQAEAPGALPSRELVALDGVVDSLLEFYDLLAEDRQLTLRRDGVASVEGNRLMLHRAIANLLSNALKHAAAGSEVRVRLAEADGVCRVSVHNLGTPIAAEALPRLFDRFYRGERGRHEGAGLGLAITRAIAQAHGGSVSVVSDDTGTVFELVLPGAAAR